ncbi:MAG TPA: acetyl-CoA acetyltransferase [Actinomycetota bacterium]|nr:acetyl-CoA acetyltransferase [Actinomycetota bacterium]
MTEVPELRGRAAIVGVADLASPTGELGMSGREVEVRMATEAIADAGLQMSDVDAVFASGNYGVSMSIAEHLGIQARYTDSTSVGGSSFEVHVEHAAAALALGLCEVALIVYGATPRTTMKAGQKRDRGVPTSELLEWEIPFGLRMPIGGYALAASRHMAVYGTTQEQLASIAVSTREWARMNPMARYQDPISTQDVLDSPFVCEPLHKLDCCLVTDGGGALVMTSADRARDLPKPPAYVLGASTCHTHLMISAMPDLTVTAASVSGPKAFNMAGIKPGDVDVVETYDSFTITVLLCVEDLGFCAKGEGGPFVEGNTLGPGGDLPLNTNGGGLSFTHPGMYGIFPLVEATRQVRGELAEGRQIDNAQIAVAHGSGGVLSSMSTIVLGSEETL